MPNPSLGCFLLVGCCLSCFFLFAFFGGRYQILRLGVSCSSGAAFRAWVLLLPFLWAMPNPSLGCFLLVGCCLSCLGSFLAFFGGDAKSLAWVFLARRVLTKWMVMGSVYLELFEAKPCCILVSQVLPCLFWGRCQIPRLGVSCSSGATFRVWFFFLPFLGAAKSLAWVFLARRVLTKWMLMGSIYLELFQTKPCCILVCPIIPYVLWNIIL